MQLKFYSKLYFFSLEINLKLRTVHIIYTFFNHRKFKFHHIKFNHRKLNLNILMFQ